MATNVKLKMYKKYMILKIYKVLKKESHILIAGNIDQETRKKSNMGPTINIFENTKLFFYLNPFLVDYVISTMQ